MHIALIGLSGAGKSSLGRVLAARLGWPLMDTDAFVVAEAGCSIADLFATFGESHFRDLEQAALARALDGPPAVVATGGGIVLREANRALLRRCARTIWLDAPTDILAARLLAHAERRPLVEADPRTRLAALRAARAHLYAAIADLTLTTDSDPEALADQVLAGRPPSPSPARGRGG